MNYIAENWDGKKEKKEVFMHTQDPYEFTDTLSIDVLLWPYCPYFSYLQTFGNCAYNIILITNTHAAPQDMLNMDNVVSKTQGGQCVNKYISVFKGNCGCNFVFFLFSICLANNLQKIQGLTKSGMETNNKNS